MTSANVYNTLLTLIRKDKRGGSLSIDEFNYMAPVVNEEVMSMLSKDPEGGQDKIDSIGYLKRLNRELVLDAEAVAELPDDYERLIGQPRYFEGSYLRVIDVITSLEYSQRIMDALTEPTTRHPVAVISSVGTMFTTTPYISNLVINCYPDDDMAGETIIIDYILNPPAPFIDYYVNDTTYVRTLMDMGDEDVAIALGYTYRDGTAGPIVRDSLTLDPIWRGDELNLFIYLFLQKLGVQVNDMGTIQYAVGQQANIKANE